MYDVQFTMYEKEKESHFAAPFVFFYASICGLSPPIKLLYFEGTDTALPSHLEGTVAFCSPYVKNFGTPLPLRGGFPPKKEGYWLNNHDNSFYACAFIIRFNNPISCEHNRLISPYNKKERSFFEEIVAISCVCEKFVVPLPRFSRRVSGDCIRTRMILGFRF